MRSAIQKKSYGSVKVFWLDKELLRSNIKKAAQKLFKENSQVRKIALFGSLAENRATAFSDADIIIVVAASNKRFIDRPDEFRDYFKEVGVATDLFIYTSEEIENGSPFAKSALARGECLVSRWKRI